MTQVYRSLVLILLTLVIVFGWLIADNGHITKDSIFNPRYVAECVPENTLVKVRGYVENLTIKEKIALIRGWEGRPLRLSYKASLAPGDEIVAYGHYDNSQDLFIAEKIYKFGYILKMRYFSSLILLPFIILIFFREYRFKDFKFVKNFK